MAILDQYLRLLTLIRQHHSALMEILPHSTLLKCARKFGMLRGDGIMLRSMDEMAILMDYCAYSHLYRGKTYVQRYLARLPPTADPDDQQLRAAMGQDRFSVYQVEQVQPGKGVTLRDLVLPGTFFVVDQLLTMTVQSGVVFGGRLLPLPGFWITTGAAFPVSDAVIGKIHRLFVPTLTPAELQSARLPTEKHELLATTMIWASHLEGTAPRVSYP